MLGLAKRARALSSRMIRRVTSVAQRAARTALGDEIPFVLHVSGDARVGVARANSLVARRALEAETGVAQRVDPSARPGAAARGRARGAWEA